MWLNADDSPPNVYDTRDSNAVQYARKLYVTLWIFNHTGIALYCVSNYRLCK